MSNKATAILRLRSPLQSWGSVDDFSLRTTESLPTRSGIAGLICAALGYDRASKDEANFLRQYNGMGFIVERIGKHANTPVLRDFHTIENVRKAGGGIKPTELSERHYLQDSEFAVYLTGEKEVVEQVFAALQNPVWGSWCGRKACIPSAPIAFALSDTPEAGRRMLIEAGLVIEEQPRIGEIETIDGTRIHNDLPLSFKVNGRVNGSRRSNPL